MSIYPPPELLTKEQREGMAEELGLDPEQLERDLDMDRVVNVNGKAMTMREWKASWNAGQ